MKRTMGAQGPLGGGAIVRPVAVWTVAAVMAAALWAVGCGGGGDEGAPAGTLVEAALGGDVTSDDAKIVLTIPPGALSEDTYVQIKVVPPSDVPPDVASQKPVGDVYEMKPDGLQFSTPAVMKREMDPATLKASAGGMYPEIKAMTRSSDGSITEMANAKIAYDADMGAALMKADVAHFSMSYVTPGEWNINWDALSGDRGVGVPFSGEVDVGLSADAVSPMPVRLDIGAGGTLVPVPYGGGSTVGDPGLDFIVENLMPEFRGMSPLLYVAPEGDALVPGETTQVAPAPSWSCDMMGAAFGLVNVGTAFFTRRVNCAPPITVVASRLRLGDAIMLADNRQVTWTGSTWTMAAAGVTANVIHAAYDTLSFFDPVPGSTTSLVFQGVTTWDSNPGFPDLQLSSSLQTATATFADGSYTLSGLAAGPAFMATDTLTVQVPGGVTGAPTPVVVDAPPPTADPNTLLGAPMGGQTQVSLPDGAFDVMYVYVAASSAAGDSGIMRFVPAADMTLDMLNGIRTAPLLDTAAIDELASRGLTPTTIYLAYYNEVSTDVFFPGLRAAPVQAGRMFQISASDLGL